jgi:hypothetical protein
MVPPGPVRVRTCRPTATRVGAPPAYRFGTIEPKDAAAGTLADWLARPESALFEFL